MVWAGPLMQGASLYSINWIVRIVDRVESWTELVEVILKHDVIEILRLCEVENHIIRHAIDA